MILRPEVEAFAQAMESQLRINDHKAGWKKDKPHDLLVRLHEEAEELRDAVWKHHVRENGHCPDWIREEAADVANFAMMIADVCGGLRRVATPAAETAPTCKHQVFGKQHGFVCHKCGATFDFSMKPMAEPAPTRPTTEEVLNWLLIAEEDLARHSEGDLPQCREAIRRVRAHEKAREHASRWLNEFVGEIGLGTNYEKLKELLALLDADAGGEA